MVFPCWASDLPAESFIMTDVCGWGVQGTEYCETERKREKKEKQWGREGREIVMLLYRMFMNILFCKHQTQEIPAAVCFSSEQVLVKDHFWP